MVVRMLSGLVLAGLLSVAAAQQDSGTSTEKAAGQGKTSKGSSQLSASDKKFLKEAADGGLAEVELGQLAAEKASSSEVKKFGQRMVDDHSKVNDELKQLAASKGVDLPQEPSAKHKATKARLSKLSGQQFDKAYMDDMVKDHKQDVAEFRRESKFAKDPDVKNFAAKTLPTLEDHLKEAQSIAGKSQRGAVREPNASQR
jgi:putative membrane protein